MHRRLEKYYFDLITGKRKGLLAHLLRFLLLILSWPFRLIVMCRNWVFDQGWVSRYYAPVPVIMSIGNIVVGGTGKTPVTLMLAQEFYDEFLIAILSRGYRSQAEKLSVPIMLSKGEGPMQSAHFCGDEPFLLAQNLPKALVVVGKDRHKSSDIAAREGAHLILLDDGMQHRRLARDFEVVVMDTTDLFGQGHFLPRGLLREGKHSLSRADLIILNHVDDHQDFEEMKKHVAGYTKAVVVGTKMEVVQVETLKGEKLPSLKGKKVGIFCGIAHPEYFHETVEKEGAIIVDSSYSSDHICPNAGALSAFSDHCRSLGAEMLLCTEKDKVKILDVQGLSLPLAYVKMRLKIISGEPEWRVFVDKVKSDLRRRI